MNLYRRSTLQASIVLLLASIVSFTAVTAQRRKPHKLRATALLEFSREGSADKPLLVPITILDDGSFHDASIYKAAPEPMALGDGVIYEAQKTGQIVGYFTVGKATKGPIWTAMGRWAAVSVTPKAKASASPTGSPAGTADERPILRRAGSAQSAPATASPTPPPATSSAPSGDRPVLQRPAGDASPAATPSPAATTAAPEPEPEDPNRPTLRRRPAPAQQAESGPSPSTPGAPAATPVAASKSPASAPAAPSRGQALVAVSDAQPGESRSYEFIWKPGEREAIEAKMRRLALAQFPRDNAAAVTEKSLTNVLIRGFDLDLSNDAVMVLTAEAHPSSTTPATKPASKAGTRAAAAPRSSSSSSAASSPAPFTRYLTLIARVDFQGEPQKLAASVTDSSRLDIVPRLELIDAVDVDGDGLAELLFREYSFDDKSFVIFGIGRTTVTKLFEGASQPLK